MSKTAKTTLTKGTFCIDPDNPIDGYIRPDENWNGFACPAFELDAIKVWLENETGILTFNYHEHSDTLSVILDGDGDDLTDLFQGSDEMTEDGPRHLYWVGAWAWVWSKVE